MAEQLSDKMQKLKDSLPDGVQLSGAPSRTIGELVIPDHIKAIAKNANFPVLIKRLSGEGCQNCGGAGVLYLERLVRGGFKTPSQHATCTMYDGLWYENEMSAFDCPVCNGDDQQVTAQKVNNSGLSDQELHLDFRKNYSVMDGNRAIVDYGQQLLAAYSMRGHVAGWLTVHGNNGVGKTFWSKCMVAEFLRKGLKSRYMLTADFLTEVTNTFQDQNTHTSDILNKYADVKVLVLDEIERIPQGSWHQTTLVQFLNGRYESGVNNEKHLTVLITNKNPHNVNDWSGMMAGYLTSRMTGGDIVEVKGHDLRRMR